MATTKLHDVISQEIKPIATARGRVVMQHRYTLECGHFFLTDAARPGPFECSRGCLSDAELGSVDRDGLVRYHPEMKAKFTKHPACGCWVFNRKAGR